MTKINLLLGVVALVLSACGVSSNEEGDLFAGKKGIALIKLASGNLVTESCLKDALSANQDPNSVCSKFTASTKTARGVRATYGSGNCASCGNWTPSTNQNFNTYYYVVNPWYYQPQQFCGYYGSSCYNYVYPNYNYQNYNIDITIDYYYPYQKPGCNYAYGYNSWNGCGSYMYWW